MIRFFVFVHFFCDTALFLSLGGGLLSLFAPVSRLFLTAAAVGLGGALADGLLERGRLRWLGLLPALATLALCRSIPDALLVLPPVVYLGICIHREALRPDQWELRRRFKLWAAAAAVGVVLGLAGGLRWVSLCGVIALSTEVFLLRMLRHDDADLTDRRLTAMEVGLLLVVCLLCVLLAREDALEVLAQWVWKFYRAVILPLVMLFYRLFDLFLYWVKRKNYEMEEEPTEPSDVEPTPSVPLEEPSDVSPPEQPELLLAAQIFGVLLFLAIAALLLWLLLRGLRRRTAAAGEGDFRKEEAELPDDGPPPFLDRSPAANVRRAYASYCKTVARRKGRLGPGDTSRSVNLLAELEEDPAAVELRGLYLRARYSRNGGLRREDARQAASLSRSLRARLEQTQKS